MITKRKSKKTPAVAVGPVVIAQKETEALVAAAAAPTPVRARTTATASAEFPATLISVKVDAGFGNQLVLRGTGPGLSWDRGLPMECVADNLWTVALKDVAGPIAFKVLVNDSTWSVGEDFTVAPGQSVTLTPGF